MTPVIVDRCCSICGNAECNRQHEVREAMFGRSESYQYTECAACHCLQIIDPPSEQSNLYPPEYYSLRGDPKWPRNPCKRFLRMARDRYAVNGRGFIGAVVYKRYPSEALRALRRTGIGIQSRVLDVGCGSGGLLLSLAHLGFRHLDGCDPNLTGDKSLVGGAVRIRKCELKALCDEAERYDLIMMHHSFEHVACPLDTLRQCAHLLVAGGTCLIRTPVAGTFAWREYGVHWFQLDAPRHLFVHSVGSMTILAEKAGFTVESVVFDSSEAQFIFSEQNRKGIAITSKDSWRNNPSASIFSKSQVRRYRKRATELNAQGQGDQAAFYLRKEA